MLSKLPSIFTHHISPQDTLIVGVSGGPDSTALLDVTYKLQPNLIVAHINHGIRGKDSNHDEKFVRQLAKSYGLQCEIKRVKLTGQSGLEERGRNIRRAFFEKLRAKYKAKWILTAHTEDDQLETIVFNFLRGSGPAGLAGMKMMDGFYFKPLLTTPKSEILAYLKKKKLTY
jgi:tRNA(Ile)-lysidine synthase